MRDIERFVYFVQGEYTRLIKIGMTENMEKRFKTLQACSPDTLQILALIKTNQGDGVYLREFDDYRVHGEWFRPTDELMEFLADIPYYKDGIPFELFVGRNKISPQRGKVGFGFMKRGGWSEGE